MALAQTQDESHPALPLVLFYLCMGVIYIIPAIVGFVSSHPNRWLIAVINLAFGGTIFGWFGTLIWACSVVHRSEEGSHVGESGLNLFVNDPVQLQLMPPLEVTPSKYEKSADNLSKHLLQLKQLKAQQLITDEEYEVLKRNLLTNL